MGLTVMDNITFDLDVNSACLEVEARSDIGGRSEQQDQAYAHISQDRAFAVVCDGMGGAVSGELASRLAIDVMRHAYSSEYHATIDKALFLYNAMKLADEHVVNTSGQGASGTTMVAVIIHNRHLFWLSVGDSRIYISRSGQLLQVTRDHNYFLRINELLEKGIISEEVYLQESKRGDALISYIGKGNITLFDLTESGFDLQKDDCILLSTDGLFKTLPDPLISEILCSTLSIKEKADMLIEKATHYVQKDFQDNTTFILIHII